MVNTYLCTLGNKMPPKHYYHDIFETIVGNTIDVVIPEKIPVINIAAANIPAVTAYCGFTVCGAYIIASELK